MSPRTVRWSVMSSDADTTAVIDATPTAVGTAAESSTVAVADLNAAVAQLDDALGRLVSRDLVSAGEMTDLLLDVRALLTRV